MNVFRATSACVALVLLCVPRVGPVPGIAPAPSQRTVAITVDDLPYAGAYVGATTAAAKASAATTVNSKLLEAFRTHHAPVTGFVIEQRVRSLGDVGVRILQQWLREGHDLGDHSYSHPDIDELSISQIEEEVVRGEAAIGPLMRDAGKKLQFFRFPMNHTGDTKEKHDAIAAFLSQRGYTLAACTIDTSDYLFNNAYVRMLANRDTASAERLRREYVAYSVLEIDYYARLNAEVLGYEPPEVMLLHDNPLNADTFGQVLKIFEDKGYKFVPLATALSDAAYRTPDTYVTKFGPMWGYRWAQERHVKVNGSLEPEPPKWISEYR